MTKSKSDWDDIRDQRRFWEWLFLLFLGLKLTGNIDWSWFWVFAPIWGRLWLELLCTLAVKFFDVDEYLERKDRDRLTSEIKEMVEMKTGKSVTVDVIDEDEEHDNDEEGK